MNQLESTKQINALKLKAIDKGGYHTMKDIILLACDWHKETFKIDLTPKQLKK